MADIMFWRANDFRGTLYSKVFEFADYEFDIGFSEFKMADPIWWTWNFGNSATFAWVCTPRFLRWLITNLTSDLRNSKWRIQYGGLGGKGILHIIVHWWGKNKTLLKKNSAHTVLNFQPSHEVSSSHWNCRCDDYFSK